MYEKNNTSPPCYGVRMAYMVQQLGYILDNLGSNPSRLNRFFSSPNHPDWLWGHTQPPIQWVRRVLSWGQSSRSVKLITHLQQMSWLRMSRTITLLPLYAFMAWTRTTLPYYGLQQNLQLQQLSTITSAAAIFLADWFSIGFLISFFSFHGIIDCNKMFLGRQLHQGAKFVDELSTWRFIKFCCRKTLKKHGFVTIQMILKLCLKYLAWEFYVTSEPECLTWSKSFWTVQVMEFPWRVSWQLQWQWLWMSLDQSDVPYLCFRVSDMHISGTCALKYWWL